MYWFELLVGQIPEAIFFSLFMIFAKNIREKRILFITLMVFQYILLTRFLNFNLWFQIIYTFITYVTLKFLYKGKAMLIDIFIFTIASLILIISSLISFGIFYPNVILATIFNKFLIFIPLILLNYKLSLISKVYKNLWNRNNNKNNIDNTKIKSTTFRSLNVVIFNMIFFIINFGMIIALIYNEK